MAFTTTLSPQGIAEIKFDLPNEKINKFNIPILKQLEEAIDKLAKNSSVKALKFTSGKEGIFIAGADLHSFEPAFEDPSIAKSIIQEGHRVFQKIHNLPFPTIAVINGVCLGGGLEFALSCTYRIAADHPKTQLGLPEVTLGIFPGWGGTQRLPRLVGLTEGLTMVLTGKSVPALKAYKIHLVDALFAWEFLEAKTEQFVDSILTREGKNAIEKRRASKPFQKYLLENNPLGRKLVFYQAEKDLSEKTKGRYPAPQIALELIKKTYDLPLAEGLKEEAATFTNNIPQGFIHAKNFISLFFTQEDLKKETGAAPDTPTKDIQAAFVIGAGTMGSGIAWLMADHNILVRLKDISWELVGKGLSAAKQLFQKGVKAKKVTPCDADRHFQLISGTIDYSGLSHVQFVMEAATENLELKAKIFQEIEKSAPKEAIIASNTSSLTIHAMAESLKHKERFVGMHFFNPVPKMPLVEVVAGKHTSPETVATAVALCRRLGKTPLVVGDCPGFLVNRVFTIGAIEVLHMLEEGYAPKDLEKALLDFGIPMGPFELADEVGIDVLYKVAETLEKAYGERMHPPAFLKLMLNSQFYGKKNGKGFYIYKGKERTFNTAVPALVNSTGHKTANHPAEEILPRFLYTMINEAARCLEEKIISRPDYLDLAMIMGTGFPPFQGGLLRYADRTGLPTIEKTLNTFTETHGMRFTPCSLLRKLAQENKSFYMDLSDNKFKNSMQKVIEENDEALRKLAGK